MTDLDDSTNNITVGGKVPEQDKEWIEENFDSISQGMRRAIRLMSLADEELNDHERVGEMIDEINRNHDRLEPSEQMQQAYVTLMKSYRNAIQKNIQLLENEKNKLDKKIEKYDHEAGPDDDVVLTIKLDINEDEV